MSKVAKKSSSTSWTRSMEVREMLNMFLTKPSFTVIWARFPRKPGASTTKVYKPSSKFSIRNFPSSAVVTEATSEAPCRRDSLAFSTGCCPLRSTMVPFTPPVGPCAERVRPVRKARAANKIRLLICGRNYFWITI